MSDDIDFRQAMKGVRRLKKDSADPHKGERQSARKLREQIQQRARHSRQLLHDGEDGAADQVYPGQSSTEEDAGLFYLRQGIQKKVLRDLKKGSRYPVGATLDLHGLTQTAARRAIDDALDQAHATGIRCLLIIHGKGLRSADGAPLKKLTARHLKTRAEVRAYCSAQPRDGGTGALYVLLS